MIVEYDETVTSDAMKYIQFTVDEDRMEMLRCLVSRVTGMDVFAIPSHWKQFGGPSEPDIYTISCWLTDDEMDTIERTLNGCGQVIQEAS